MHLNIVKPAPLLTPLVASKKVNPFAEVPNLVAHTAPLKAGNNDKERSAFTLGFWLGALSMGLITFVGSVINARYNSTDTTVEATSKVSNQSVKPRSGVLNHVIKAASEHSIASSVSQGGPMYAILFTLELLCRETMYKAKKEFDTPKYFEAHQNLKHAKTLFESYPLGFSTMSSEVLQESKTTLDRAATLFREAGGGLKDDGLLLKPIYSTFEVVTHLLAGKREVAQLTANRALQEYNTQRPAYEEFARLYNKHRADFDDTGFSKATLQNVGLPLFGTLGWLALPVMYPFGKLLETLAPTEYPKGHIEDIYASAGKFAFHPELPEFFQRIRGYYGYDSDPQDIKQNVNKLLALNADNAIFRLMPEDGQK